jgi:uncharacterized protein (TIGR02145 family)
MVDSLRLGQGNYNSTNTDVSASFSLLAAITDGTTSNNTSAQWINAGASYGYLYNWYAATAGTGTANLVSAEATSSICPKGWRLPTGGSSGDFALLNGKMNGEAGASTSSDSTHAANWQSSGAWRGVLSGNYSSGLSNQGGLGYYWSSTASPLASGAYYLAFGSSYVFPANGGNKYGGFAVRCVVR